MPKDDLVERRQKYIDRQIALDKGAVNVEFAGRKPAGTGQANRHGMPKLPVGQREVRNWPVMDLGEHPDIAVEAWKLEVGGLVENPLTLTWAQFSRAQAGMSAFMRDDWSRSTIWAGSGSGRGSSRAESQAKVVLAMATTSCGNDTLHVTCRGRAVTSCCWSHLGKEPCARTRRTVPNDQAKLTLEGREVDPQDRVPARTRKASGGAR